MSAKSFQPNTWEAARRWAPLLFLLIAAPFGFGGFGKILSSQNVGTIYQAKSQTTINRPGGVTFGSQDWGFLEVDAFSLDPLETLTINQAKPDSTLVIRVINYSGQPSELRGQLESNGRVILIDGNGLDLRGAINVTSFMGTTLDFDNGDLSAIPIAPIESQQAQSLASITISGSSYISAEGGYYRPTWYTPTYVDGNIYLFAPRIKITGGVFPEFDGSALIAAGDKVRTYFGNHATTHTKVLEASNTYSASSAKPLIEVSQFADLGLGSQPSGSILVLADAAPTVADHLATNGLDVIRFDRGAAIADDDIVIDGGGAGTTALVQSYFKLYNPGTDGRIDVLGADVRVHDSTFNTLDGAAHDEIRIGGDEADLGTDRHGAGGGTRIAHRTRVDADVFFDQDANERLHITGYSVLREGELPIMLISEHDGPLELPWMLDRETVYLDSDDDGDIDTCNLNVSTSISFNNDDDVHEMLEGMTARMEQETGMRPTTLELRVHRKHVDANRRPGLATGLCHTTGTDAEKYALGPNAENNLAYLGYHDLIGEGEQAIADLQLGGGGTGLMLELHGHKDGGDNGPLHLGYRIDGEELHDLLADAVSNPNPTEADFDDPDFIDGLNVIGQVPGSDLEEMIEDSSSRNIAETLAAPGEDAALWEAMFGPDSIFKRMRAKTDASGNDYNLYIVEDVGFGFGLRTGGFVQRRHGSSDDSDDACDDPVVGDCEGSPHQGFVYSVDGIQFETPRQYRFYSGSYDANKEALILQFREDLADSVLHYVEQVYGHSF